MLAQLTHSAVVAILLAAAVFHAKAVAESPLPAAAPEKGMVVLRNGEVIEGKITRAEGLFVVDLPDGQIRLKEADVDLICSSLEDGYLRKRSLIEVGNVHQHLELAQWCLRHELLGPVSVELADATVADPKNPMIGVLRHRLKMAMEPPPAATSKGPAVSGPSNDELDQMIRGMPRGAVESFTQSVQPVLLNHCTNSGCHGSQCADGLRLYRIPKGNSSSRRVTQRNLYSVMQFIDQRNPSASKLLEAASAPHGTVQYAVFAEHQASQYQHLSDWVHLMAQRAGAETPATIAPAAVSEPPPPSPLPQREAKRAQPLPAPKEQPSTRQNARSASKSERPADPFDPEVFNRRYAPAQQKQETRD